VDDRALVELRCSAIVFRGEAVLLLGRRRDGTRDWVLPGGHPRPREGTATCVYREVLEETGLDVQVGRVAFVLETTDPAGDRRLIDRLPGHRAGRLRGAQGPGARPVAPVHPGRRHANAGAAAAHRRLPARPAPHAPAGNRSLPGQPLARAGR
jgi:8-oxo-dGTP pyrophosphatase MutT (NUDIX family)